jgi:serine/threonine protein kinase
MIHGDLVPTNIFWLDKELTVIDFGLSKLKGARNHPVLTTDSFRAPEIFLNQMDEDNYGEELSNYDESLDLWSVAATLHVLFTQSFLIPIRQAVSPYGKTEIGWLVGRLGVPDATYLKSAVAKDKFFVEVDGSYKLKDDIAIPEEAKTLESLYRSPDALTQKMKDLMGKCLRWDPKTRITVKEALEHPLFEG